MPQPSETIFDSMKADERYKKRYLDRFDLTLDPVNILQNVVPNNVDDFFPTKVCNVICLTGIYDNLDTGAVSDSVARLKAVYKDFAKYELHILIDADATNIAGSSSVQVNNMITKINNLIDSNNLGDFGVTYDGKLSTSELTTKLRQIADAFYGIGDG